MTTAVLVSGAGSGIGRAIAGSLADAGHQLVLLGRNAERLEQTRESLPEPGDHSLVCADIRDARSVRAEFERLHPSLCGVVANAGVGGGNQYGEGDRWQEVLDTNLTGTYLLVREALPFLAPEANEYGHIVVISSILARLGVPGYSAYCASKAGLLGLVRSWAVEFAPQRILVNALCPGWVNTEMAADGLKAFADGTGRTVEEAYAEQMSQVLLGKMSEPEEIGAFVRFLMSAEQTSMTGQSFDINNGALMPA